MDYSLDHRRRFKAEFEQIVEEVLAQHDYGQTNHARIRALIRTEVEKRPDLLAFLIDTGVYNLVMRASAKKIRKKQLSAMADLPIAPSRSGGSMANQAASRKPTGKTSDANASRKQDLRQRNGRFPGQ